MSFSDPIREEAFAEAAQKASEMAAEAYTPRDARGEKIVQMIVDLASARIELEDVRSVARMATQEVIMNAAQNFRSQEQALGAEINKMVAAEVNEQRQS